MYSLSHYNPQRSLSVRSFLPFDGDSCLVSGIGFPRALLLAKPQHDQDPELISSWAAAYLRKNYETYTLASAY